MINKDITLRVRILAALYSLIAVTKRLPQHLRLAYIDYLIKEEYIKFNYRKDN